MTSCTLCRRPLTDPVSIQREMGPECWAKLHPEDASESLPSIPANRRGRRDRHGTRSHWSYIVEGAFILVEDQGTGMSVTNDAEEVVHALSRLVPLTGKRILYRDTDGRWDELLHTGPTFTGFAPLGAPDQATAIAIALFGDEVTGACVRCGNTAKIRRKQIGILCHCGGELAPVSTPPHLEVVK